MVKIAFLLYFDQVARFEFWRGQANPGVGGTPFTTIQLAIRLAERYADWQVTLVNSHEVVLREGPANLATIAVDSVDGYLASRHGVEQSAIVSPVRTLATADLGLLRRHASRLIAWSRHPYDRPLRELDRKVQFASVVSVGAYQFHTNRWLRAPTAHIQNVFDPPAIDAGDDTAYPGRTGVRFVHMGALVRGKRFHLIAQQWPRIEAAFPDSSLHVIGGSDVHRSSEHHPLVPCDPAYAAEILEHIPEDAIHDGRVVFHGTLGAEKYDVIRESDVALLNPTGHTEAFPASPLECMWTGCPVIGSGRLGMWDAMQHFPELQVAHPAEITARVQWLLEDADRYGRIVARSQRVAQAFQQRTPEILDQWGRLLDAVAEGTARSVALTPLGPPPRASLYFTAQIARRNFRRTLARGPIGWSVRRARTLLGGRHVDERGR